jgi:hypothetical protein
MFVGKSGVFLMTDLNGYGKKKVKTWPMHKRIGHDSESKVVI